MSARRTFAALAGTALIVLVVCFGAGPAGAATGVQVVERQVVPTAVGMMPAQLPEPADKVEAALADVLYVAGLALLVAGMALALQAVGVQVSTRGRRHRDAVGYTGSGVDRGQLLAA